ncbi:MAG: HAD family hydrolase [Chloroflexi bacterium]|nr:HAD family hydrolase [Chloroflexota bacterium]
MVPLRGILFDFGHTLVDWVWDQVMASLQEAYREHRSYLESLGVANLMPADELMDVIALRMYQELDASYERRDLTERDFAETFRRYLRLAGIDLPPEAFQELLRREHAAICQGTVLPPASLEALEELRRRGYRLGMVSNMDLLLDIMRLDPPVRHLGGLIPVKVLSSGVGLRKPHPRIYEAALEELGLPSEAVLFVGDRVLEDIRTPKALGVRAAVLSHEFRQEEDLACEADATVRALPDLVPLLEQWPNGGHPNQY